jgi:hypothetical protein
MYWFLAALPPKTNTFFRFQSEALDFAQALVSQMPSLTAFGAHATIDAPLTQSCEAVKEFVVLQALSAAAGVCRIPGLPYLECGFFCAFRLESVQSYER